MNVESHIGIIMENSKKKIIDGKFARIESRDGFASNCFAFVI